MAGSKSTQALSIQQSAFSRSKTGSKTNTKNPSKTRRKRNRRGRQFLHFSEAEGKTVEFVEMATSADFPCVEIGFTDKTALLVLMDTRLTMEPAYSNWKTGDQRVLRRWPVVECS